MDNNRGSAVVEASIALPIFIFFAVCLYHMCMCRIAENIVYEAAIETAEYMAEYAYLDGNGVFLPQYKFNDYIDNEELAEKYISGGVDGVSFLGTVPLDDEGYTTLTVRYTVLMQMPFVPTLEKEHSFSIRQKAYVGANYADSDGDTDSDVYVYVTDNRDVYHSTRSCTYLVLSIHSSSLETACAAGYTECEICGHGSGGIVYITDYGDRYHSDTGCSGLKRTVYRVKLDDVRELGECTRCANH